MAGNAVLLKHAPNCFGSGLVCEELLAKLDIPDGLFRSLLIDVPQVSTVLEHPSVQGDLKKCQVLCACAECALNRLLSRL